MDTFFINLLALASLVYYPSIPLVILFIHKTLPVWRKMGKKSYYYFIALFFIFGACLFIFVFKYKDTILAWRWYDNDLALLGLIPLIFAFIVGIMSIRMLSLRVLMGIPEIIPDINPKLVINGIYQYLRHPRYLEFILEVMGIAILSGLAMSYILALYFIPLAFLMARAEEHELVERFGESYIEYRKKTGGFIPRFS